jgi:hypothetical protein
MSMGSENGFMTARYAWAASLPEGDYEHGVALLCGGFGAIVVFEEYAIADIKAFYEEQGYTVHEFRKVIVDTQTSVGYSPADMQETDSRGSKNG